MVSIKEATENAIVFALAALGPARTTDIRLEEVESTKVAGQDAWLMTLSMISPDVPPVHSISNSLAAILGNAKRDYKSFTVLKDNGEVTSMKIRELADA